ncbi:hypothetical protein NPN23_23915, partial [Vibrio parahaemolyticus]|nr:hypothetical protein [Vibrio parahaemolyticus]
KNHSYNIAFDLVVLNYLIIENSNNKLKNQFLYFFNDFLFFFPPYHKISLPLPPHFHNLFVVILQFSLPSLPKLYSFYRQYPPPPPP